MSFDTICVVGLGYIGLPTAAMFASRRKKVIGVDINEKAVDTINRGEIHIVEPELDIAVHSAVKEGYLKATTKPEVAEAFLVAVPTPFKEEKEQRGIPTPDLSYIKSAAKSISEVLKKGDLVILESTSPVGATEQLASWLAESRPDLTFPQDRGEDADIQIAHCPERVLPGHVMRELIENDRIVGGMTKKAAEQACELYSIFVRGECLRTNARTAEMAKLTENAFRDVNIAFANELSIISDKLRIDVWDLISLANRHPRVNILQPGPGVGGHCIAVDPWFIASQAPEESRLIKAAREVNNYKPEWVIEKIQSSLRKIEAIEGGDKNPSIAFYGLTFKANIDDIRESPALQIVKRTMAEVDAEVLVVEPNLAADHYIFESLKRCDYSEALLKADIHVMLVDHKHFVGMKIPEGILIDTRGVWPKK